jgi:hypothetical protein
VAQKLQAELVVYELKDNLSVLPAMLIPAGTLEPVAVAM